jgi:hypothetical protein
LDAFGSRTRDHFEAGDCALNAESTGGKNVALGIEREVGVGGSSFADSFSLSLDGNKALTFLEKSTGFIATALGLIANCGGLGI